MANEMVRRVAVGIWGNITPPLASMSPVVIEAVEREAKAAIAAMLLPTPEMIFAATSLFGGPVSASEVITTYQHMIRKAME